MTVRLILVALVFCLGCGGQKIQPLDPHDLSLPIETRQFLADAEDSIIAARARRDVAVDERRAVDRWRSRMASRVQFKGAGASQVASALNDLLNARVRLAELELDRADVWLQLAKKKHLLLQAERAVLHDLARYNLKPVQDEVASVRGRVKEASDAVWAQREKLESVTGAWWQAYAQYVGAGGETRSFWLAGAAPIVGAE